MTSTMVVLGFVVRKQWKEEIGGKGQSVGRRGGLMQELVKRLWSRVLLWLLWCRETYLLDRIARGKTILLENRAELWRCYRELRKVRALMDLHADPRTLIAIAAKRARMRA